MIWISKKFAYSSANFRWVIVRKFYLFTSYANKISRYFFRILQKHQKHQKSLFHRPRVLITKGKKFSHHEQQSCPHFITFRYYDTINTIWLTKYDNNVSISLWKNHAWLKGIKYEANSRQMISSVEVHYRVHEGMSANEEAAYRATVDFLGDLKTGLTFSPCWKASASCVIICSRTSKHIHTDD